MEKFVEIQNFGLNTLTVIFFITLFFTFFQASALFKQNRKIVKNKSGLSVSFVFFCYYGFSALAVIIYGWHKLSLALMINGLLGFIMLMIIINLLRFKKIALGEKVVGLASIVVLPLIIFAPQKDLLFLIFGSIINLALFLQVLEIWRNKSSGSVHPGQTIVSLFSNTFWLGYAIVMHIWPLKIVNSISLALWFSMLFSYYTFNPKKHLMKLNFKCYSENGAIFEANTIMKKPCGLVVVGKVQNGSIHQGDTIGIQEDDKMPLYDTVMRIELDHEKIAEATKGMLVGICLPKTSKDALLQYLGK